MDVRPKVLRTYVQGPFERTSIDHYAVRPQKRQKMTEEKPAVNINIHGGNNQILPNATHAEQHFHYHATDEKEQSSRACIYNNVCISAAYG